MAAIEARPSARARLTPVEHRRASACWSSSRAGCVVELRRRPGAVRPGRCSIGLHERRALRPGRPGLHDGVRHHRADQLRPRRPVHARLRSLRPCTWSTSGWASVDSTAAASWLAARSRWWSSHGASAASINVSAERLAYRRLRSAPKLAPLITAVGLSFVFRGIAAGLRERLGARRTGRRCCRAARQVEGVFVYKLWMAVIVVARHRPAAADDLDRAKTRRARPCGRRPGPGRRPADGHQRQPHHLVHVRSRRRPGRRGRRAVLPCPRPTTYYDTGSQLGLIAFTAAVLGGIGNLPAPCSAAC